MANDFQVICDRCDLTVIPTKELCMLVRAKMGIDLIGSTLGPYGADSAVIASVCKQFGYEFNGEEKADA